MKTKKTKGDINDYGYALYHKATGEEKRMNYEKLKQVIQSICTHRDWQYDDSIIRLADVLKALNFNRNIRWLVDYFGYFCFEDFEAKRLHLISGKGLGNHICWNLKEDNLDNQSEETKEFLIKLLCKE